MSAPYVCVAGQDASGRWVRPVRRFGRLNTSHLVANGGPFDIGAVVELAPGTPKPSPPEVEDREVVIGDCRFAHWIDIDEFWESLDGVAYEALREIFGSDLRRRGRTATVEPGTGTASLGCFRPAEQPLIEVGVEGKIRLELTDPELGTLNLPVTDLRLYEDDLATPRRGAIDELMHEIDQEVPSLLCVGLTRPFPPDSPQHWLQVNNIHLEGEIWSHGG